MKRKIIVCLINIGLGFFVAYMSLLYIRERNISTTQCNIACNIVNIYIWNIAQGNILQ